MHGKYLFIKSICYTCFHFLKLIPFKTVSKPHKTRSNGLNAIKKHEVVWVVLHFNTVNEVTQFQKCRKNIVKSLMRIAVTL